MLDKLEHPFSTFFIKTLLIVLRTKINNATGNVSIILPQPHLLLFFNKTLAFIMAFFHQVNIKIIILSFQKNILNFLMIFH